MFTVCFWGFYVVFWFFLGGGGYECMYVCCFFFGGGGYECMYVCSIYWLRVS